MSGIPTGFWSDQGIHSFSTPARPTSRQQQVVHENGDHYDGPVRSRYTILVADVSHVALGNFSRHNPYQPTLAKSQHHQRLEDLHRNRPVFHRLQFQSWSQAYVGSNSAHLQGLNGSEGFGSFFPANVVQPVQAAHPAPRSFYQPVEQFRAAPAFDPAVYLNDVALPMYHSQLVPSWSIPSEFSQASVLVGGLYPIPSGNTDEPRQTSMPNARLNAGNAGTGKNWRKKLSKSDESHALYETLPVPDEDGEGDVAAIYQGAAEGEENVEDKFASEKTPMQLIAEYQAVCGEIDTSYKVGQTFAKDGKLYTKDTPSGAPAQAKYLYENICEKASQGRDVRFSAEGVTYDHPRKEGTEIAHDVTAFVEEHKDWSKERGRGRPDMLLQFRCTDGRKGHKRPTKFDDDKDEEGRLLLNADSFPIRKLQHMPQAVSSMIPGWEVEAICRLNPEIGDLDFRDRMAPVIQKRWEKDTVQMEDGTTRKVKVVKQKDGRPTRQNLNMRRVRDRQIMRIPTWPEPKNKTVYDQRIEEELDQWGITNSTARLSDLDKAPSQAFAGVSYLSVPKRAGKKALAKHKRASQIEKAIDKVKQGGFTEDSAEVQGLRERFLKIRSLKHTDDESAGLDGHPHHDSGEGVADVHDMAWQTYVTQSTTADTNFLTPSSTLDDIDDSDINMNGDSSYKPSYIEDFVDFDTIPNYSLAGFGSGASYFDPLAHVLTSEMSQFDPVTIALQLDADLLTMSHGSASSMPPLGKRKREDGEDSRDTQRASKKPKVDGNWATHPPVRSAMALDPSAFDPLALGSQAVLPQDTNSVTLAIQLDAGATTTPHQSLATDIALSKKRKRGANGDADDAEQSLKRAKLAKPYERVLLKPRAKKA